MTVLVDSGVPVDDRLNTVCTSNEEGFARVLTLYARPGATIADPTFGNGRFWRNVDQSLYDIRATDLACDDTDLRALPYEDDSLDMVVLDPPYRYTPARNQSQDEVPGHGKVDGLYNLQAAALTNTTAVIDLYVEGFKAEALGFACRDLLVVAPSSVLKTRWNRQRHLRKAHSYFLVFRTGGHFPFGIPSTMPRGRP